MIRQFKTYIITEELIKNKWNVCKTAEAFGVHRNSLTRHISDLGITRDEYKETNGERKAGARVVAVAVSPNGESDRDGEESIAERIEEREEENATAAGGDITL